MTADLDISPLSWVKDEIEIALDHAATQLRRFDETQNASMLAEARAQLHQVRGALMVVGIEGVTVFALGIEHVLDAITAGHPWSSDLDALLQEGIVALRRYLDEITAGRPDQPLRLMPLYARLREHMPADAIGDAVAPPLFLPDLSRQPPRRPVQAVTDPQARQVRLKAARLAFERGLAKWMQHDANGLRDMRHAVVIIEALVPEPARAFWWVVVAWLDAHLLGGLDNDGAARRIGERLDAQVRRALDGAQAVADHLLRDVLYGVAIARSGNAHIDHVRAVYGLPQLLPPSAKTRQAALDEMRGVLAAASESWEALREGAAIALPRFHDLAVQLHALSEQAGNIDLNRLTAMQANVAALLRQNPLLQSEALNEEIALALLLIETALDDFAALGARFKAMTDAVIGHVGSWQRGEHAALHDLPDLVALARRANQRSRLQRVTHELRDDLRLVEQALDGFFRGQATDEALIAAALPLQKIAAKFEEIEQSRAVALTRDCGRRIESFGEVDPTRDRADFRALARDISALGLFVEQLRHGAADLDTLLATAATEDNEAPMRGAVPAPAPDSELVAIFVEEVHQVHATIDMQLMRSVDQPGNLEHLTILRRCFHTLKGSARLVGLREFGDTAYAVEAVLNAWLADGRAAVPALHAMLDNARHLVTHWADRLAQGGVAPETRLLHMQCDALKKMLAPSIDQTPIAADESVTLGDASFNRHLYETYVAEARVHAATLREELQYAPSATMARAAHTLASSSAAIGIVALRVLAGALEQALERCAHVQFDAAQRLTLQTAVAHLEEMVESVAAHSVPRAEPSLVSQLDALSPVPHQPAPAMNEARLLSLFLDECEDLVPTARDDFRAWHTDPAGAGREALRRTLHTLKGGARMAAADDISVALHDIETRLEALGSNVTTTDIDALHAAFDTVVARLDALKNPATETNNAIAVLRVPAGLVDAMSNEAGEVAIARARIENGAKTLRASLTDLSENVARLRAHLRELEIQAEAQMPAHARLRRDETDKRFDPLELDRFTRLQELTRVLAESVDDVATVETGVARTLDQMDDALAQQARLSRGLTQHLMRVRMLPFAAITERLRRVVEHTAQESGKAAEFVVEGGNTELDRAVLDRITSPIEHLLRNAVVHGLEHTAARGTAGKAERGRICIRLAQTANYVVIDVEDDGAGLDLARIRAGAVARGLIDDEGQTSETQLTQLIFEPGFSTADSLSEDAGRGVGMDVVRNEVALLGGHVEVQSQAGRGARFSLRLPLTLAVMPVVLVKASGQVFGIPSSMVVQANELKHDVMTTLREAGFMSWRNQSFAFCYLPHLLGDVDALPLPQRRHWVLLLRHGAQRIALEIDGMVGNDEVVTKSMGPQLARVPGIAGAAVLGDGDVALLLNPGTLLERQPRMRPTAGIRASSVTVPTVMVVDDSLTVRKITGRLIERAGYRVITAKDGIDALEQLADAGPDVLLADIEMPRMDGFELLRRLRDDTRFATLPIIMITSRSADKHRNHALELGANHYLGKPYDEEALLALIADYTKGRA